MAIRPMRTLSRANSARSGRPDPPARVVTHDTDANVPRLVQLILAYRDGKDLREVVTRLDRPSRNS
jgi:hypothetical protein